MEKSTRPASQDLEQVLGETFEIWRTLAAYTYRSSPGAIEEWAYGNTKTGWGFRISQRRKVLVQLLPRDKFFQAAFILEQKTADAILASDISEDLKTEIKTAKVGLEGRSIKIDTRDKSVLDDLKKLISAQAGN